MSKNLSKSDEGVCTVWNPFCEDRRIRAQALALAFGILRDRHEAEEVVQESYLRMFLYSSPDTLKANPSYFFTTVRRRCFTRFRDAWRQMNTNAMELDRAAAEESQEASMEIPDPGCTPETNAEHKEKNARMLRTVQARGRKLTAREYALLRAYIKGYSNEEIASAWGEDVAEIRADMNALLVKVRYHFKRENNK